MSEQPILRENTTSGASDAPAGGTPSAAESSVSAAFAAKAPAAPTAPAVPVAPVMPAEPTAPKMPAASAVPAASAAPAAPRSERPARRVGTLTMGVALILVGAAICTFQFMHDWNMLLLFCKLSPLLLVALGCEVLVSSAMAKGARLKYDFLSMFVCLILLIGTLAASCLPIVLEYEGPGRSSAEMRVEQSIYNALYDRLKENGNISRIYTNVNLAYSGGYDAVQSAADLKAGDYVYMTVEVRGEYADKAAFVKACRPALEALRAQGLPYLTVNFRTVDAQDGRAPHYTMDLSGRYQMEMSDAELVQYVTEQLYIEEAGYYMTPGEAAEWADGRLEKEQYRQEELDVLREQLAEAEERAENAEFIAAEAQLANEDAEQRVQDMQEQLDSLYQQLEDALADA